QLGIAIGLGLLVGLQREKSSGELAGMRTFPLVTLLGAISALLAQSFGGWVIAAGLISLAMMIVMGNLAQFRRGQLGPGLTTEVAILLMFGVGAYLVTGYEAVALAIGGGVAVLLQFKGQLHGIARKLGDEDLKAVMQFALISLVILPILPNRAYGPYAVLNPRNIWWMVVLIVGISLAGYIVYKFFGERAGTAMGGLLGGTISSTATTVSYSRQSARSPQLSRVAASVIMTASAVVLVRVMIEIAVVAPSFLAVASPPLLVMLAAFAALSAIAWRWGRAQKTEMPPQSNPSELKSALLFGLLYGVVVFAIAAAKDHLGERGLYLVAGLSGLTDMDAITLSVSQLVEAGRVGSSDGWRLILVAMISNLGFKGGTVILLGHRALASRVLSLYFAAVLVAGLLLIFW
ncbi:MAG: MgtC/SapB family protein, partial [Acidobacteriota bacterium]